MADKNAVMRARIGGILYDLMVKSNVFNISVDEDTMLPDVIQAMVTALNGKVKITDIVDDLTSGGQNVPLSAEMGKQLKAMVDKLAENKVEVPTKLSQLQNDAGYIRQETDPTVPEWAKQPKKPGYSAEEILLPGGLNLAAKLQEMVNALNGKVKTADIVNDLEQGGQTIPLSAEMGKYLKYLLDNFEPGLVSESDPTVPEWAKQPNKPSYTAADVGLGNVKNERQYSPQNPPPYPVTSVNGLEGDVKLTAALVGALPDSTTIPGKTSQLTNDSGFITKAVSDLANYYRKSESYTKEEIDARISTIPKFGISVVSSLPTTGISETTIYLVPGGDGTDLYTEFIRVNGAWEILGSQKLDLTGYAKESWVIGKLEDYLPASALTAAINTALAQAKASGEFDGDKGQRGTGLLNITTAPASYTTVTGGFTPTYRIALSTVLSQSKAAQVLAGDTLCYSYYYYPVGYVDGSYVYLGTRKSIRGATGATGPESNVTSYTAQNVADSIRLTGKDKTSLNTIVQSSGASSTILVKSNESGVEHVRISNSKGYAGKIGIDVGYPAQRLTFYDLFIEPNYAIGIQIPTAYYSQFLSCWIQGDIGIAIGDPNNQAGWIGVLDFAACHFNNSGVAAVIYSKDTNTICFDKCSFEGDDMAFDNYGLIYVRNSYFGDQLESTNTLGVLIARPGSKTYFSDCTIGVSSFDNGGRSCLFDLRSNATDGPSLVMVQGGKVALSNNYNRTGSVSTLYAADSADCLIYFDNVTMDQPDNVAHNRIPYYIYDGYSPLRSRFPLRNYVANGTMCSKLGNAMLLAQNSGLTMDAAMMNPFGGSVLKGTGSATWYYKVPRDYVGKAMTLELYMYTPTTTGAVISSDGLGLFYAEALLHKYEDARRPVMYRLDCVVESEKGSIVITQAAAHNIYGVVLKEKENRELLSCYEDISDLISDKAPTTTVGAEAGDIVENVAGGYGWRFDGKKWASGAPLTYTVEAQGKIIRLLGSDGSVSEAALVETKPVQYSLTKCTSSNTSKTAVYEGEYTTTLTADEDYGISSVKVTMNDVDVTADVYDSATQTIYIPIVTGRIVITAVAVYVPFVYVVPDIAVAPRNAWYFSGSTLDLHSGNEDMAIGVSTANSFGFTDRESNKIYAMPVPAKASKVTVAINDGVAYKYQFRALKETNGVLSSVNTSGGWITANTFTWVAGAVDYILIWAETTSGSGVPWGYDDSQVTVTFESTEP